MNQLRILPASFAASAIFLFSSFAGAVAAPPAGCGTGPACGQGFECTVVGASGCAPAACAPGHTCPDPEPCTETQEMGCTLAHCSVDSDCASGMLCHVWEEPCAVSDCACASDQPNCDCAQPACDPITVSMCTPRYLLPCEAAADCGTGFTCEVAPVNCSCGGSAPGSGPTPPPTPGASPEAAGGASDAQDAVPTPDPTCTCETSAGKQCVVEAMNCQSSAQCPAGWTCEQEAIASAPACAGKDCKTAPPPTPTSSCRPPYYGGGKGVDPAVPGGTPITTGSSNGSGGGTSTTKGGSTKPETKATDDGSHESSACSMGHAPASSGALAMLAMLGALFGLKRRRN